MYDIKHAFSMYGLLAQSYIMDAYRIDDDLQAKIKNTTLNTTSNKE